MRRQGWHWSPLAASVSCWSGVLHSGQTRMLRRSFAMRRSRVGRRKRAKGGIPPGILARVRKIFSLLKLGRSRFGKSERVRKWFYLLRVAVARVLLLFRLLPVWVGFRRAFRSIKRHFMY